MEAAGVVDAGNKKLGMKLFIISDSLTFAAVLLGYCYLRLTSERWPKPFGGSSLFYAVVMSLCLFASSWTMARAVSSARRDDWPLGRRWLAATITGGIAFLVMHLIEWRRLVAEGLTPSAIPGEWGDVSHAFGATFFGITGLHMLHVLAGIILLAVLAVRSKRSKSDVEIGGMYWQFVDAVWVFVFALLYLPSIS